MDFSYSIGRQLNQELVNSYGKSYRGSVRLSDSYGSFSSIKLKRIVDAIKRECGSEVKLVVFEDFDSIGEYSFAELMGLVGKNIWPCKKPRCKLWHRGKEHKEDGLAWAWISTKYRIAGWVWEKSQKVYGNRAFVGFNQIRD